jgi:hypothetical protein
VRKGSQSALDAATQCPRRVNPEVRARSWEVRFAAKCGHPREQSVCLKRANKRLMHRNKSTLLFDYFVGPNQRCGLEPHAELGGYLLV